MTARVRKKTHPYLVLSNRLRHLGATNRLQQRQIHIVTMHLVGGIRIRPVFRCWHLRRWELLGIRRDIAKNPKRVGDIIWLDPLDRKHTLDYAEPESATDRASVCVYNPIVLLKAVIKLSTKFTEIWEGDSHTLCHSHLELMHGWAHDGCAVRHNDRHWMVVNREP
jgi:hypothetical protein